MKAGMVMVLAVLFGLASMQAAADDSHHPDDGKAVPSAEVAPKNMASGGKACKSGSCGKQNKGMGGMMGGCCCAAMMRGRMGHGTMHGEGQGRDGMGVMGPEATMEVLYKLEQRMAMMQQRMDMMQSMMQKGAGGEMPR